MSVYGTGLWIENPTARQWLQQQLTGALETMRDRAESQQLRDTAADILSGKKPLGALTGAQEFGTLSKKGLDSAQKATDELGPGQVSKQHEDQLGLLRSLHLAASSDDPMPLRWWAGDDDAV